MEFFRKIEEKWQKAWDDAQIFEADPDKKKKFFVTFPYPYINGPLHFGHAFTASRVDIYARFKRMQGYNVLFPWAWHWTGQPLIGASQRVAKGDKAFIQLLKEVVGVKQEELEKFSDPIYMATYYTNENRVAAKRAGFSVDWRREFNTIMPTFQRFIEWQYQSLRAKGYVTRGTHPVVWCPKCRSPTGDHDRQEGEGVTPEGYILIKFKLDQGTYLPAATFRPETIYGVTNIWMQPDATYVEAEVDNERWIISREAAKKLNEQGRTVKVKSKAKGRKYIGRSFENPVTGERLLILPGWFVDTKQATGIVYSVPAHAPYDWLALKELQEKPEILHEFDIEPEAVKTIRPISMIKVEGFGEYPAIEIVQKLDVKDQHDPRAEKATKTIYKKEFHSGFLKENCKENAGKRVQDAKEGLTKDFMKKGIADSMYDLPQSVVCRCLTPCIVKVLQDQWFLKYSDPKWKEDVKEALSGMRIYPETATQWFIAVIDWLKEWACARRTGLGTALPWSQDWIVETLSDSTIYMAFYTINKHIKQCNIKPEMLTDEVFNHIFYEKGNIKEVSSKSKIDIGTLKEMKHEFSYWYPVDLRVSAKELVPNHLTFFLFQHVAMFPQKQWPRAIGVNGMLMIEGEQMHKSKGNFIPVKKAIGEYGADATRCSLILSAEGMDDPDWREENVKDIRRKLESFYSFAKSIIENTKKEKDGHLEKWIMSRMQHRISEVTDNLEVMKTRTALEISLFEIWNDFRWYVQREGSMSAKTLKKALEIWLKLLAPFAPHICEELWNEMKNKDFISLAEWPQDREELIDIQAEEKENLLKDMIEDTLSILKATKMTPRRICYYTAAPWKWKVYLKTLQKAAREKAKLNEIMRELALEEDLKSNLKEIAKFASKSVQKISNVPQKARTNLLRTGRLQEKKVIEDAREFLAKRFRAQVVVYSEDEEEKFDPKRKAPLSIPLRPAIYIE